MSAESHSPPKRRYRHLFGPVPSRRLGRSLGVDLVEEKVCTYDCLFCEVGRTRLLTTERKEYVPTGVVVGEIRDWVAEGGSADVITLAGSGEPTLHTGFGDIIDAIHGLCSIRVALLTNGSLFYLPEVRLAAARADLVKVSLSAWDAESLQAVNRPEKHLDFSRILEGLRSFRDVFHGELWLEVFVLNGINDRLEDMKRVAGLASGIRADRIHINTVVRPPAYGEARPAAGDRLVAIRDLFGPNAELIAGFVKPPDRGEGRREDSDDVLAMLDRRPCTVEDVASVFRMGEAEATKCLDGLLKEGRIRREHREKKVYYVGLTFRSGHQDTGGETP